MTSLVSLFLSLVVCFMISIQLTSSASFPNPPQFPPPNASADEWSLFFKLLHNYYAIIARPRFGKRYDEPSFLEILNRNSGPLSSENVNNDQQISIDDFYTFAHSNRRR